MTFLLSLAVAGVFIVLCAKLLKQHAVPFYLGATVLAAAVCICTALHVTFPSWFSTWVWPLASRSGLSAALFAAVMWAGALPNGSKPVKTLMPIRGELSILACILTLGHNISYGMTYFARLTRLPGYQLAAAICSIVMLCIMLPLFVTSFRCVRKKMAPKVWKRLQRLAYGFYGLLYVHVLLLTVPQALRGRSGYALTVFVYSVVFLGYALCRIAKAVSMRQKATAKLPRRQLAAVALAAVAALGLSGTVYGVGTAQAAAEVAAAAAVMASAAVESELPSAEPSVTPEPEVSEAPAESEPAVSASMEPEETPAVPEAEEAMESSEELELSETPDEAVETPEASTEAPLEEVAEVSVEPAAEAEVSEAPSAEPTASATPVASETPSATPVQSTEPAAVSATPVVSEQPVATPEPSPEPTPEPEPVRVYENGTFSGTAFGYDGNITVSVTIQDDVITAITVTDYIDDDEYFSPARSIISSILSAQSTAVDTVSGATYSSTGIRNAVANALASAKK